MKSDGSHVLARQWPLAQLSFVVHGTHVELAGSQALPCAIQSVADRHSRQTYAEGSHKDAPPSGQSWSSRQAISGGLRPSATSTSVRLPEATAPWPAPDARVTLASSRASTPTVT